MIKRFGRETALAGVDLSVPQGAVYLLAGTNGAGKSTLLRTLLNIERPDGGAATVLGMETSTNGPKVRACAGYVPETGEGTYRWRRAGRFLAYHASFQADWDEQYAQQLIRLLDVRMESRLGTLHRQPFAKIGTRRYDHEVCARIDLEESRPHQLAVQEEAIRHAGDNNRGLQLVECGARAADLELEAPFGVR